MGKKKTHAEYVAELAKINPDIEVVGIYMGANVKIPHRCKKHNVVWDIAPTHALTKGYGCAECKSEKLSKKFNCEYDDAGSIGKRYRREDEIGTPYCVTIDFDTLEDNKVTIRDRDTMEQVRIDISEVEKWISEKINF